MVPIVCCLLLLIALVVLLWSLRLLLPLVRMLLVQVLAVLQVLAVDPSLWLGSRVLRLQTWAGARQTGELSKLSPPAGKAREKLKKRSNR